MKKQDQIEKLQIEIDNWDYYVTVLLEVIEHIETPDLQSKDLMLSKLNLMIKNLNANIELVQREYEALIFENGYDLKNEGIASKDDLAK